MADGSAGVSDREALRAVANELLDLESERDYKQAVAQSYDTAPGNPQAYSESKKETLKEYKALLKKIDEKKQQKQALEQRVRAAKNERNHSSTATTSGDMNLWSPNNNGWEQASYPYRMSAGTSSSASQGMPRASWNIANSSFSLPAQSTSYYGADPFGSSGRNTPVNNKRSYGSTSLDVSSPGRNKTQRISDVPADVIDLTGDDDDISTSISLSMPHGQQALSGRHALAASNWTSGRQRDSPSMALPFGSGSNLAAAQPGRNGYLNGMPGSYPNSTYGNGFSGPLSTPSATLDSSDLRTLMPGTFVSDDDDDYGSPFTTAGRLLNSRTNPSSFRSSLSTADVINRTRNFNFMDLTDGYGNPLDARVASIMQDINDDPRKSREEVEALLRNVHAGMEIPEEDREGTPDAMRYPLYAHQRVALTWMKRQENNTNKGGILADDMGLGKTISVLSLMVSHKPEKSPKTTLIVAPLSLIRQWEDEIKKKIKSSHALSVHVYHNTQKIKATELMKFDVVLTTYGTLVSEKKKLANWWKDLNGRQANTKTDPTLASSVSLFHPNYSMFYRIVLDESQMIKNRNAQAALAAAALQSKYRWCLSGTPMMNGVDELFSLYHFLKIKPYCDWNKFRVAFGVLFGKRGDPKSQAMRNLQVLLKATLLRRTKTSEIDGKPILQLPEKTEEIVFAVLDEDERKFYTDLETNSQVQINKYLRKGTLGKHYSHVLVLLLRLRQSCCHPHLLLDSDEAVPEVDDRMLERVKTLSDAVILRLTEKSRSLGNADAIDEGFECPICYDMMPDPTIPLPCGHELCAGCLKQHIDNAKRDNIRNGEENSQVKCAVCRGPLDPENIITFSAFKRVHMPDETNGSSDDEDESDGSVWSSDEDEADKKEEDDEEVDKNGDLKNFIVPDNIYDNISDADEEKLSVTPEPKPISKMAKKKEKKVVSPNKKAQKRLKKIKGSMLYSLRKDAKKNAAAWRDYTKYLSHHWLSSAKARACMELLKKIQETGEKTIVFSQWTMMLDLLEVAIKKEGLNIKHCRYTGEMSMAERDDCATRFTTEPSVKVMMVSLRAGNAGLNLVAASNVVIMDPFWNPYIEMQAVDRAYRIGQQKPVKVYRVLTQQTVEDRIIQLQEKKRATVDAALDEREGAKLAGLSMTELRFLFNL
ncbi:swi snf family dna-dependent atpase [Colletotrichum truncatum]|uniref:Swi snf family dna-dependent atpase n=1 Tax=Colletotrichum truncatum TaxID=5467 RepID=A0ACC3Z0Y4_COLTU|nr:swi snf family dna-dependent atpase [Colletotrichum truncatum]KAF6800487.1 swi snf family dna-dependent atpase [Colletotrichum truncatum]